MPELPLVKIGNASLAMCKDGNVLVRGGADMSPVLTPYSV